MANRFVNPIPQFIDNVGQPYASGSVQFCLTGTDTPTDTYNSSTLAVANPNPVLLNAAGRFSSNGSNEIDVFLDPNVVYRVKFYDVNGVLLRTVENVRDHAANATAAFQVFNGNPNGNVAGSQGTVGGAGASVVWDFSGEILWICTTTGTSATAVWTAYGSELNSIVTFSGICTPSALAADANDYDPTGFGTSSHLRQDSNAAVSITGFGSASTGRFFTYHNTSIYKHTLRNQNSGSVAAKRIAMDGDMVVYPGQSVQFWYDAALLRWVVQGAFNNAPTGYPGGRVTLTSGVPVLTTDVSAATTVYYTPYRHNFIRLYNGTGWYVAQFSELSQTLADSTKSPLAAAVNSVYDLFLWDDAGTLRLSRGPSWTVGGGSVTARGTGAGSTELERVDGVWMNKNAITNGAAARRGIYVGTIATNGTGANGQLNMQFAPSPAAGGTANRLDVWNCYNRVRIAAALRDSTTSWSYAIATWRQANASASNKITCVVGLQEDAVSVRVRQQQTAGSAGGSFTLSFACGIDSTTVPSGDAGAFVAVGGGGDVFPIGYSAFDGFVGIGRHDINWLENATSASAVVTQGTNGTFTYVWSGMVLTQWA